MRRGLAPEDQRARDDRRRQLLLNARAPPTVDLRRAVAERRHEDFVEQRSDAFRIYARANPGLLSFQYLLRLPPALLPRPGGYPSIRDHARGIYRYVEEIKQNVEMVHGIVLGPNSWVRIGLHSMNNNYFISTRMAQWRDFNDDSLYRMFTGQHQDGDNEEYDEIMEAEFISIVFVGNPDGSGYKKAQFDPEDAVYYNGLNGKVLFKSYSFPDDHMCAQRSLVLLWLNKDYPAEFKRLNRPTAQRFGTKVQSEMYSKALELSSKAGVDHNQPVTFEGLLKLSQALTELRGKKTHIIVVNAEKNMEIVYRTLHHMEAGQENYDWFALVLRKNHYDAAPRLHRVMHGQGKFCFKCFKTYNHRHICVGRCPLCDHLTDHTKDPHKGENKYCDDCYRTFSGIECYTHHKEAGVCLRSWKCLSCNVVFQRPKSDNAKPCRGFCSPEKHACYDAWCSNCHNYTPKDHECFVNPLKDKPFFDKYVFADFETDQSSGQHIVNLAVSIEANGFIWPVFYNIHDWVAYMLQPEHKGKTFIFHNGRGFDFHPILNELMVIGKSVKPTMAGRKVIFMNVPDKIIYSAKTGRRFIDSVNFLPMPLKAFSKTFNLEVIKGHYPHFFNTEENKTYVGVLPEKSFYGYDTMNNKDKKEFDDWYVEEIKRVGDTWDNKQELLRYCQKDVELLKEGCMKFRALVMQHLNGHDPFQSQTLSSSSMAIFRTLFLQPKTIGAFKVNVSRELRGAFNGGRVEAFKLYKRCEPHERIAYVDFTSLYPFCNSRCRYPIGHPHVIEDPLAFVINDVLQSETKLAVLHVDIECPQDLYIPLLHSQDADGLLMFDLRTKISVKYTNLELKKAIELGYRITRCYKVYIWEETYVGLFEDYIKRFLKIKQEAAGWPNENMTDEEKKTYLEEYKRVENVELDSNMIKSNEGLYKMAKLYLNSLWGKFAQRNPDMFDRTSIIHDTESGHQELNILRAENRITDCYVVNEKTCLFRSKPHDLVESESLGTVNIAVGIFTTAHARLKLYNEFLEKAGHRLLYCDTDSCVFYYDTRTENPQHIIPLGDYLGQPTSEVGTKNEYDQKEWIEEFVSGGPKHYAYRTNKNKMTMKVKGLNMKQNLISEHLTFENMKQIVLSPHDHSIVFHTKEIRIAHDHSLINLDITKSYQLNFTKRQIDSTSITPHMVDTFPWKSSEEINDLKQLRKQKKRKRDLFENHKGFPVYFSHESDRYSVSKEEPSTYFMSVYNFQDENDQTHFMNGIDVYECKTHEDVFDVISTRIKCDWIIQLFCKTNYFDFNKQMCRIIYHVK